ncbi:MAG: carbohydrate ABC transporter permease, partial [Chloroflexota bacterium]
ATTQSTADRKIVTDEGTVRRDTLIANSVFYIFLSSLAIVALTPFYWMLSTSTMSLGETIQRRWFPNITFEEDFARVGVTTSSETGTNFGLYVPPANQERSLDDIVEEQPADLRGFGLPIHVNYITAWQEANFGKYFFNSVVITGLTIVGLLLTSIPAAYAFARIDFVGRNLIFTLLLATLMIPESVVMIPNFLVARGDIVPLPLVEFGAPWAEEGAPLLTAQIGNNYAAEDASVAIGWLARLEVVAVSWLNRLPALTVPFMANAFSIFLLRQFFAKVPDELWDAARIDGCGHTRFLIQIATPIVRPAIVTVVLLTFINTWNAFLWPLLVTTRDTWRPLMVGLWTFVSEAGPETHLLMAGAVITILPMLILYFFTQKTFTEGIATSGLKG